MAGGKKQKKQKATPTSTIQEPESNPSNMASQPRTQNELLRESQQDPAAATKYKAEQDEKKIQRFGRPRPFGPSPPLRPFVSNYQFYHGLDNDFFKMAQGVASLVERMLLPIIDPELIAIRKWILHDRLKRSPPTKKPQIKVDAQMIQDAQRLMRKLINHGNQFQSIFNSMYMTHAKLRRCHCCKADMLLATPVCNSFSMIYGSVESVLAMERSRASVKSQVPALKPKATIEQLDGNTLETQISPTDGLLLLEQYKLEVAERVTVPWSSSGNSETAEHHDASVDQTDAMDEQESLFVDETPVAHHGTSLPGDETPLLVDELPPSSELLRDAQETLKGSKSPYAWIAERYGWPGLVKPEDSFNYEYFVPEINQMSWTACDCRTQDMILFVVSKLQGLLPWSWYIGPYCHFFSIPEEPQYYFPPPSEMDADGKPVRVPRCNNVCPDPRIPFKTLGSPPQKLLIRRAKPFSCLKRGTWLHRRPVQDVYLLLLSAYRLRQEDNHRYVGPHAVDIYATYSSGEWEGSAISLEGFEIFLWYCEYRKHLLPSWWTRNHHSDCLVFAYSRRDWRDPCNVKDTTDALDCYLHTNQPTFLLQLRVFAEYVYGYTAGKQCWRAIAEVHWLLEQEDVDNFSEAMRLFSEMDVGHAVKPGDSWFANMRSVM